MPRVVSSPRRAGLLLLGCRDSSCSRRSAVTTSTRLAFTLAVGGWHGPGTPGGRFSMHALVRAGLLAALFVLFQTLAFAADKPFHRDDLADSAIRLEAQIKKDAGPVVKPAATLKREADAASQRSDSRLGMTLLGQIVATNPDDAASWLRLARAIR